MATFALMFTALVVIGFIAAHYMTTKMAKELEKTLSELHEAREWDFETEEF